ncbi:MAG: hypothetical protein ACREMB_07795 [Candidatus Rokuibacteriota bacterium]
MAVARRPGARGFDLRATTSLARLRSLEGRREEGRALLARTLAGVTEGLETGDVREACAVLAGSG